MDETMERLTDSCCSQWLVKGTGHLFCKAVCEIKKGRCEDCPISDAIDRIAAYEDAMPLERARELAQAEKNGRLVVPPCKVGDTVYIIRDRKIIITTVETIHQWSSEKWILNVHTDKKYRHWVGYEVSFDDFCKTVFLTREEAEAELKKREDDICTATGGPCCQCQPGPCGSRKLGEEAGNEAD